MTPQQHKDKELARTLATLYYGTMGINKVPVALNSQQYDYFVKEWNKLKSMEE